MSTPDGLPWTCVLFDLDGTLVDSGNAIMTSLEHAFAAAGLPVPGREVLRGWVGPPVPESLALSGLVDEAQAIAVNANFRAHYDREGVNHSIPYEGIAEVLAALRAAGLPTAVATLKPQGPAEHVVGLQPFAGDIDIVVGSSIDEGRKTKADSVREALARLAALGADVERAVLVGDRSHDVVGAADAGIDSVFAGWGYGMPAEAVGATAIAATPRELLSTLRLVAA